MLGSLSGLIGEALLTPVLWIGLAALIALAMAFGTDRAWSRSLRGITAGLTLAGLAVHHASHAGAFRGEAAWGVSAGLAVTALLLLASLRPWSWMSRPAVAPQARPVED